MKVLSIIAGALSAINLIIAGSLIPLCVREENGMMLLCIAIVLCFFVAFSVFAVINAFSKK